MRPRRVPRWATSSDVEFLVAWKPGPEGSTSTRTFTDERDALRFHHATATRAAGPVVTFVRHVARGQWRAMRGVHRYRGLGPSATTPADVIRDVTGVEARRKRPPAAPPLELVTVHEGGPT